MIHGARVAVHDAGVEADGSVCDPLPADAVAAELLAARWAEIEGAA